MIDTNRIDKYRCRWSVELVVVTKGDDVNKVCFTVTAEA